MTKAKASNLEKVAVTGSVLADLLGTSKMTITRLERAAVIARNGDNLFPLKDSLRAIYQQREPAAAGEYQSQMERDAAEKLHWQAENEKTKNIRWRVEYALEVGEKIVTALDAYFTQCREAMAAYPEPCRILRELASKCRSVDLNAIIRGQAEAAGVEDEEAQP